MATKKEARILNAIPKDKTLEEYFDSLDVFEKREMIEELKHVGKAYGGRMTQQIGLASISWIISFLCFLGIQEAWAAYYLIAINIPLSIFLWLNIRNSTNYNGLARHFEKRM